MPTKDCSARRLKQKDTLSQASRSLLTDKREYQADQRLLETREKYAVRLNVGTKLCYVLSNV